MINKTAKSMLKKLFPANPYRNIITTKERKKVKKDKRFSIGESEIFGEPIWYSDSMGFLHSVEEIFIQEVYRFTAPTTAPRIIDAGANVGLSVLYFKKLYPEAHIIAFEPDQAIFKLLEQNISIRKLNDVELKNAAVWTEDGFLTFYSEGSLAGSTEVDIMKANEKQTVKAERLRKYLADTRIDFLKMDIEGAENKVVFDIQSELNNVDKLFIEYHSIVGKEQMLGEMLVVLKTAGFKYYIKSANDWNQYPFQTKMEAGFDLQLNIFCYR